LCIAAVNPRTAADELPNTPFSSETSCSRRHPIDLNQTSVYDVIIVGGGPAGLSAALVLARCVRRVLIVDAGNPRNARSHGLHGYLTRDGERPSEFLRMARAEVLGYGVEIREATVMSACPSGDNRFSVTLLDESTIETRKVLLATGVVDRLPDIEGIKELYGKSVHHCPYCDGWEHRGQAIAVYGTGSGGMSLALAMKTWSQDVVLCTGGPSKLRAREKDRLAAQAIPIYENKIRRLEGSMGELSKIVFENGESLARAALFFSTGHIQRSELPSNLGCTLTGKGAVRTTHGQRSNVKGVFVAGDATRDVQYVAMAAAEGAKAGMAINVELQQEDQFNTAARARKRD
jgi:thioredoxin reductase